MMPLRVLRVARIRPQNWKLGKMSESSDSTLVSEERTKVGRTSTEFPGIFRSSSSAQPEHRTKPLSLINQSRLWDRV